MTLLRVLFLHCDGTGCYLEAPSNVRSLFVSRHSQFITQSRLTSKPAPPQFKGTDLTLSTYREAIEAKQSGERMFLVTTKKTLECVFQKT